MKSLSKILFALYLLLLSWFVLFKLSFDIPSVLDIHLRSLNLVPFAGTSHGTEMIANIIVFIPFGLLLSVNLKRTNFWVKLAYVFFFSVAFEAIQFVLAIGITDITDVITNTLGGLFGLMLYRLSNKDANEEKLDKSIVVVGTVLFIGLILLRFFVFRVRYR